MSGEGRWRREVPLSPAALDALAGAAVEIAAGVVREPDSRREDALVLLRSLVETRLTPRQRAIVDLYFTDGLTQQEIAEHLGISQQAVSRQLFGVIREGRRIGGAIARLRRLCDEAGIAPDEWV